MMGAYFEKYGAIKTLRLNYFELGRTLLDEGHTYAAEEAFLKSLKEDGPSPQNWELNIILGETCEAQKNNAEAVKYYLKGINKDLKDYTLYFDRISKLADSMEVATAVLAESEEGGHGFWQEPDDPEFECEMQIILGKLHLLIGDIDTAEDYYDSISTTAPDRYRIRALIGKSEIDFINGEFAKSRTDIEEATQLIDRIEAYPKMLLQYVRVFLALEQTDNARLVFEGAKPIFRNEKLPTALLISTAEYFLNASEWNQTLFLIQLVPENEMNVHAYSLQLESLIALNRYAKAESVAEIAFQYYPLDHRIIMYKVQAQLEGQNFIKDAVRLFRDKFAEDVRRRELDTAFKKGFREEKEVGKELDKLSTSVKRVEEELEKSHKRRRGDVNADFFLAFVYVLLKKDSSQIEDLLASVRIEGVKDDVDTQNESQYKFKSVKILDGYRHELLGDLNSAAENYFAGAKEFYWEGKYNDAKDYFKKTIKLEASNRAAYWYLADSYRLLSRIAEPPHNDPIILKKALDSWNRQPDLGPVENSFDYWGYLVAGRIHNLWYNFSENNFKDEIWKSLLYAEKALIFNRNQQLPWTDLGRAYSFLDIFLSSYEAHRRAYEFNKDDLYGLDEYARALLNVYRFDEAIKVIEELEAKSASTDGHKDWDGFIEYMHGNYDAAIKLFLEYLETSKNNIWGHLMIMESYWFTDRLELAEEMADDIIYITSNPNVLRKEMETARAYFIKGELKKSIEIATEHNQLAGDKYHNSENLYQAFLLDNQIEEAEDYFRHFVANEYRIPALKHHIKVINNIKVLAKEKKIMNHKEVSTYLANNDWTAELMDKMKFVEKERPDSFVEIQNLLKLNEYKEGSIAWITLHAGLGRLYWEKKDYKAATSQFKMLMPYKKELPEAAHALKFIKEEQKIPNER